MLTALPRHRADRGRHSKVREVDRQGGGDKILDEDTELQDIDA